MADDGAPVISLFPGAEGGRQSDHDRPLRERETKRCSHYPVQVELDEQARRVYCIRCGQETPAFDVLDDLRREWDRYISRRKRAALDAKHSEARVDDLRRQERNAKARLRRAEKRSGDNDLRRALDAARTIACYAQPQEGWAATRLAESLAELEGLRADLEGGTAPEVGLATPCSSPPAPPRTPLSGGSR